MTREQIENLLESVDVEIMLADGLDDAFLGITDETTPRAVYSRRRIIEILMNRDKMEYDEATEYYEYNILGSYIGDQTPIYIQDLEELA